MTPEDEEFNRVEMESRIKQEYIRAMRKTTREEKISRPAYIANIEDIRGFAKLIAEKEREACAEICDGFYLSWINIHGRYEFMGEGAQECAQTIRARGQA